MNKDNKDTPGANDNDKMPELPQKFTTVYCEGEKLTEAGEVVDCYSANQMYAYGLKCRYIDPINAFPQDLIYKSIPDAECWAAENKRIVGDMWINGFNECRKTMLTIMPLVALSDNTDLIEDCMPDTCDLTEDGFIKMTAQGLHDFANRVLAGQVAPQATVEPLTDEQIDTLISRHGSGGWQMMSDMRRFTRAVLASAIPLINKATIPKVVINALNRMCEPLHETVLKGVTAEGDAYCMKVIREYILSTSKADTSEAIRNAALEEAAKICMDIADECGAYCKTGPLGVDARLCEMKIRTLKSSTPSTIKAEPTGEQ